MSQFDHVIKGSEGMRCDWTAHLATMASDPRRQHPPLVAARSHHGFRPSPPPSPACRCTWPPWLQTLADNIPRISLHLATMASGPRNHHPLLVAAPGHHGFRPSPPPSPACR
ncbi:hypothetical protein J6590_089579 [Homalodisca vitripennis]|nr:hypothetical protein J6590_089579 [Homalodisca vitripennis]